MLLTYNGTSAPFENTGMKLKPAVKIAIAAVAIGGGGYLGYQAYVAARLSKVSMGSVTPGKIALVAINAKGYHIIVANRVAQLRKGSASSEFSAPGSDDRSDGSESKPVSIRDLLEAIQGDEEALQAFVMKMNEIKEEDLPPNRIVWSTEEIERALNGEKILADRLVKNLNVTLEGKPLSSFTLDAIESGIVVEIEVPLKVNVDGKDKVLLARVLKPFRSSFAMNVSKQFSALPPNANEDQLRGIYAAEASRVGSEPGSLQDIPTSLRRLYAPGVIESYRLEPEILLSGTKVIVTDSHILNATSRLDTSTKDQDFYAITFTLNEEGRDRMWKYSHDHQGFQLLLSVNGIGVAAPRIAHDMWSREVTINRIPEKSLVDETVTLAQRKQ